MIIAIDPGSNNVGYAVMSDFETLHDSGTIRAKKSLDFYDRLAFIVCDLQKISRKWACETLAIEDQHASPVNLRSGLQVAKAAGYIVRAIGLPTVEISPSAAKMMATGRGNAGKDLVRNMIIGRFVSLQDVAVSFDECDAIAIGLAYFS